MKLSLPFPPSANRYWRVYRGRPVVSAAARDYKTEVGWLAKAAGLPLIAGGHRLTVTVYRSDRRRDLSNCLKITEDALNGIAYTDDNDAREIHLYLVDVRGKKNARIEVEVDAL